MNISIYRSNQNELASNVPFTDSQLQDIFEEQKDNLKSYLSKITDASEAESLATIAVHSAINKYRQYSGETNFRIWIYSMATNLALDRIRKKLNIEDYN